MEEKEIKTEQPSEKVEITSGNSNNSNVVDKKTEKQIMHYNKALIEKALQEQEERESKDSKQGIGFVLGFFFSLIGLLIGFILYQEKKGDEMKTFTSGWVKGFLVSFVFSVIVCVVYYLAILPLIK
jgi:heme/copper-type cytochrome/quinol oxidase subunit 4